MAVAVKWLDMPDQTINCWGCGQPLVFKTMKAGQIVAFLARNPQEPHSCPRIPELPPIFLPALVDYRKKVDCPFCPRKVYRVPARNGMDQLDYAWLFDRVCIDFEVHPHNMLPGIWDYRVRSLATESRLPHLPKPRRLVSIVCTKSIVGPSPLHLIALKCVSGRKLCSFFSGPGKPACGDLAVLCGRGDKQKLLVNSGNSNHVLAWDSPGDSENLCLPRSWHSDA
jgi:hypothetical protein